MRLPTDSTLLLGGDADPALVEAWGEEGLPVVGVDLGRLEGELEAIGTATVVACGVGAGSAATLAAGLGYRAFLVGETSDCEGVRAVSLEEALFAVRNARARERWKAARAATARSD